jgi:hypothetical protein
MWKAAADPTEKSHALAKRLVSREHFRQVYEPSSSDQASILEPAKNIYDALIAKFGADNVRRDAHAQKGGSYDFPVFTKAGEIDSSLALSQTLSKVPTFFVDRVYVSMAIRGEAERWVEKNRDKIITKIVAKEHSDGTPSEGQHSS